MKQITLEELLSAGCHFGHQVNRSNPRANSFIFESRANVHIIDLEETHKGLMTATEFVKELASDGGTLVVVGSKRQAKQITKEQVERAQGVTPGRIFYVSERWIGGTLTNLTEVSKNFKRLKELEELFVSDKKREYTKRELALFERELEKLKRYYGGLQDLKEIPDALFIIDTHYEKTAVREAERLNVKTLGIVDTNGDPSEVTHAIPANDDAVGSLELIISYVMDAWIEGSKEKSKKDEKEKVAAEKEAEKKKAAEEKKAAAEKKK